jgi:hypothetical protein
MPFRKAFPPLRFRLSFNRRRQSEQADPPFPNELKCRDVAARKTVVFRVEMLDQKLRQLTHVDRPAKTDCQRRRIRTSPSIRSEPHLLYLPWSSAKMEQAKAGALSCFVGLRVVVVFNNAEKTCLQMTILFGLRWITCAGAKSADTGAEWMQPNLRLF